MADPTDRPGRQRQDALRDSELAALRAELERRRGLPDLTPGGARPDTTLPFGDSLLREPSLGEPGGGADLRLKIDDIERAMRSSIEAEAPAAQPSLPGFSLEPLPPGDATVASGPGWSPTLAAPAETAARSPALRPDIRSASRFDGPPTVMDTGLEAQHRFEGPATRMADGPPTEARAPMLAPTPAPTPAPALLPPPPTAALTAFAPTLLLSDAERLEADWNTAALERVLPPHEPLSAADPWLADLMMGWSRGEVSAVLPALQSLVVRQGPRAGHPPTWLCLFDAFRSAGMQAAFQDLGTHWTQNFGVPPPRWELPPPAVADGDLLELTGAVTGDLGPRLKAWEERTPSAAPGARAPGRPEAEHCIDCRSLQHVDFLAAGDLYNWAVARRSQGVGLRLLGVSRLVGLFLQAVGLPDVASIELA